MIKTELYFGRSITGDGDNNDRTIPVTALEVRRFLENVVSPRFPGFTVLHGQGYWEGKSEDMFVVVIIHKDDSFDDIDNSGIDDIVNYYKDTYYQTSVIRVHSIVYAKF